MNKSLYLLLTSLLALISCKSQYMVRGSSNVDELEGKVLTLKVYVDGEMKSIDSTRVVHGRFNFGGGMDSTMLANVFLGDLSVMPIVSFSARHNSMPEWPSYLTSRHR